MFDRFYAKDMLKVTENRKISRENSDHELTSLYLNLANFYISESAQKGASKCGVYLPRRVQSYAIETLLFYGYKVLNWENRPNWFIVSWEEE